MSEAKSLGQTNGSEIAIIGMACRFPSANNIEEFWTNLRNGLDATVHFTDEELLKAGVDAATLSAPNYVKAKPQLSDIDLFDAGFFGFNPREAELVDPQHRLFLENVWEALESAGYDTETYEGAISIYAGTSASSYFLNNILNNQEVLQSGAAFQVLMNNLHDSLATRIAYKLNLKGASYTVQTFCSTSLVAVHLACQALLNFECDTAVAGGVSITVPQKTGYFFEEGGIASPDGHCRAFDAQANGTVFGSGVGSVVLKRLDDAVADGDPIHAVILGTATNNDGADKVSYSAPSVTGQSRVIAEALANADVSPEDISYVEAHGTGTSLGDPAEVLALTRAFQSGTSKKQFCRIGSVKTNIGHLDAAAGVASLIKTVLSLKHEQLPPSLHFETPNPEIDFPNTPFFVNSTLTDWKDTGKGLFAGVSSFGIGGTNAHVIVRNTPAIGSTDQASSSELLILSAKSQTALDAATDHLAGFLKQHPNENLGDVAYTLQTGRRSFNHRRAVVCTNSEGAIAALTSRDARRVVSAHQKKRDTPVVFMFSGQGAQYENMGRDLYDIQPIFREWIDKCAEQLKPNLGLDLREILFPASGTDGRLKETQYAQPALFTVEYALAKLWMSWGIKPKAMIGHSIGEYVAACLSDVFSLEDALALVAERGRLMQSAPAGSMLAVPMSLDEVEARLQQNGFRQLSVAAINGPAMTVVSGATNSIEEFEKELSTSGFVCSRLHTSHAFHSAMMDFIVGPFLARVREVKLSAPKLPYVSNVTGKWITDVEATDPHYWSRHLRQPVHFSDGLRELLGKGDWIFLEVGPGQSLSTLTAQHSDADRRLVTIPSIRHAHDQESDNLFLIRALGKLWTAGANVNWKSLHQSRNRRRVTLPTYPFERQRYWITPPPHALSKRVPTLGQKRSDLSEWTYVPSWKRVPLATNLIIDESATLDHRWLVFTNDSGTGLAFINSLRSKGSNVVTVRSGNEFSQLDGSSYQMDPSCAKDYVELLKRCTADGRLDEVVSFWNESNETDNSFQTPQELGFFSLLHLGQAIGELSLTGPLNITVVTSNVWDVTNNDVVAAEKATIVGACKVLPQEYPGVSCRVIDISQSGSTVQLADRILNEIDQGSDQRIAYRGKHRWVQFFEPLPLAPTSNKPIRLRDRGVYLITGGLGGIGLVLAEHLARSVHNARLILVSRSGITEKNQWNDWLASHDAEDRQSQKIRKLQELESLGAEIVVYSADVSHLDQMKRIVSEASKKFGSINGVIHAAGVAGGGIIQYKTRAQANEVTSPKIKGALVLDELVNEKPIDFFVLCSSMAAIAGGFGQVDYCAANAFLDAFAHRRNTWSRTVSINWDVWQEVGMAVNTDVPADLKAQRLNELKNGISSSEGVEIFNRILQSDLPQVAVVTRDVWSMLDQVPTQTATAEDNAPHVSELHPRPTLVNDYVAPRNEVEKTIIGIWQQLLGIDRIGIHDNFFELGGHSLLGMQLASRLNQSFQVETPLRSVFESQTVARLAEIIAADQAASHATEELETLKMIAELSDEEVEELFRASSVQNT